MTKSIQDQLFKAGLANKNQVNKAKKKQKSSKTVKAKFREKSDDTLKNALLSQEQEKLNRDKALNLEKQNRQTDKALQAQIQQIIKTHRVAQTGAEHPFYFTVNQSVKKLYINEQTRQALQAGSMGIVVTDDVYCVVPDQIAEKIKERDACAVVFSSSHNASAQESLDYSDYPIPDDLMW